MRTIILGLIYILYMIFFYLNSIKYKIIKSKGTQSDVDAYMFKLGKTWSKRTLKIMGTTLEIRGKENILQGPCLFVANHQSYFDVPIIVTLAKSPMGFVAKKQLGEIPFFGVWIKRTRSLFLDRDNTREAIRTIGEGVKLLQEGHSLGLFPEGTRSKGGPVGEFKKGSLKLGTKSGVPIIPVTIDGAAKILEETGRLKKAHVIVTVDKPIYPKELSKEEQNQLTDVIRNQIIKNLNENK